MKKLIILSVFMMVLSATMFAAASSRVFNQQLVLENEPANPADALDLITNTGLVPNENYILRVTANGETRGTDLGQAGLNMRIYQNMSVGQLRAMAMFNQSLWSTNWVVGSNLVIDIWYKGAAPTAPEQIAEPYPLYQHVQKTWVVVAGSVVTQVDANAMVIPPYQPVVSDTWNYNLTVNGPAGYTFTGGGAVDAEMGTILHDDDDLEPNTLIGEYTASTPPVGYHWLESTITVAADDFVAAKADVVKNATITFELVANDMEIVDIPEIDIPSLPAGLPITNEIVGAVFVTWFGTHDLFIPALPGQTSAWAFIGGSWIPGGAPNWTWTGVNFDGKGVIPVAFFGPPIPLPVELSSFAATLTAQNFVKLTWVSETETNLSGYRVYRNDSADQATAVAISGLLEPTNTSQTQTYTHIDNEVSPATNYSYWLEVVEMDGTTAFHGPTNVYVEPAAVVVPSLVTTMDNAYPNPFKTNSSTSIAYQVKAGEAGTITIYNIIGQVVKTVPVTETTSPKTFTWNGRDSKGNACGSGIYFYKLSTPSRNVTKKMVIVN